MLKKVLIGVAVLVLGVVVVISMQPAEFKLERSAVVSAAPEHAFAQVNDFHQWAKWSPWDNVEGDNLKRTFGGPETGGVGATYAWVGDKTGEGNMKITESKPAEHIKIDLNFTKPMTASNITEFHFAKEGEGTKITWTMSGKHDFMGKAFGLVMNMDKMVGGDFEKGLAGIKTQAEAAHGQALAEAKAAAEKKAADEAAAANAVAAPTP